MTGPTPDTAAPADLARAKAELLEVMRALARRDARRHHEAELRALDTPASGESQSRA